MCCNREKLPVVAVPGKARPASSTDARTWRSYGEALAVVESGRWPCFGRVIEDGDPFVGIDLDGCRDPETGALEPWARECLELLDSYSEVSPTGTGVKVWVRATLAQAMKRVEAPLIEIYPRGRYFTVTGQVLAQYSTDVEERQGGLEELIRRYRPKAKGGRRAPEGNGQGNRSPGELREDLEGRVEVLGEAPDANAAEKYRIVCPWVGEHSGGDESGTYVGEYPDGAKFFTCNHAHCFEREWADFRDRVWPPTRITVGGRRAAPAGFSVVSGGRLDREREWPKLEEEAYRGLFGRVVELAEEHTEGDPVALLVGALTAFGSAIGRGPYMQIGATRHHVNLFVGIVGDTSKGRKGSTWDPVENVMHAADKRWTENRIQSGLSSGEGLISEVRDRVEARDKEGKMRVIDGGVSDKRLLVMEGELSQVLKVIKRDGNTLSPVLRNAWDGKNLKTMVKHSPLKATEPHVSVLGHITRDELARHLSETEMANGLANRYLWVLVKRSKRLPFGGEWHTVNLQPISREIVGALEYGNRPFRMAWGEDAKPLWIEAYDALTEDRPGMFGAVTARAEAQTLRLAMLYALADCSDEIRRTHVESALAVWEYAEESARYIFGDAIGDPDADKVLEALKDSEEGLTRTEIRDLFGRNKSGEELDRIFSVLSNAGRIRATRHRESGSKKPVERWYAA